MGMNSPIRILLVEDESLWQEAIAVLLSSDFRFRLVGIADNFEEALQLYDEQQPDVVLLDWKIQGEQDGLAVGNALLSKGLSPERMVLISGSSPSSIPTHPFLYIPKNRIGDELLPLLASVTIN